MRFFQQIFKRYQQGQSSPQEQEMVNRWYDATGNGPRPDWMHAGQIQEAKETAWQNITRNLGMQPTPVSRLRRLRPLLRYTAAAVVTGVGIWGAMRWGAISSQPRQQPPSFTTYTAGPGAQKHITLPDGTEIWLNNGSSLQLSSATAMREVWLTEGEAYFQVAKDPERPFIVHVDSLQTRVLGTAFNIKAYRALQKMQIAVSEGKVQVGYHQAVLDTLSRNMQLDFHPATGEFAVKPAELSAESGWWNNRFVLNKAGFDELALRLKLKYGITLVSSNKRILNTAFSASFRGQAPAATVLETLCALYNTRYSEKGDTVIIQ